MIKHILPRLIVASALTAVFASPARADPPKILDVTVSGARISVTVAHADTGWDHYADGWQVQSPSGAVLGTRVLHHPHVTEQPFTRSLTLDAAPDGPFRVIAKDNLGHRSAPFAIP